MPRQLTQRGDQSVPGVTRQRLAGAHGVRGVGIEQGHHGRRVAGPVEVGGADLDLLRARLRHGLRSPR